MTVSRTFKKILISLTLCKIYVLANKIVQIEFKKFNEFFVSLYIYKPSMKMRKMFLLLLLIVIINVGKFDLIFVYV